MFRGVKTTNQFCYFNESRIFQQLNHWSLVEVNEWPKPIFGQKDIVVFVYILPSGFIKHGWKIPEVNGGFMNGQSPMNSVFSIAIAMFDDQRVTILYHRRSKSLREGSSPSISQYYRTHSPMIIPIKNHITLRFHQTWRAGK